MRKIINLDFLLEDSTDFHFLIANGSLFHRFETVFMKHRLPYVSSCVFKTGRIVVKSSSKCQELCCRFQMRVISRNTEIFTRSLLVINVLVIPYTRVVPEFSFSMVREVPKYTPRLFTDSAVQTVLSPTWSWISSVIPTCILAWR